MKEPTWAREPTPANDMASLQDRILHLRGDLFGMHFWHALFSASGHLFHSILD
jgi:hypothetical protein